MYEKIVSAFLNPINEIFIGIIFILFLLDLFTHKDLKSQIVSMGVLGTFVGIFIGLLDFNPADMKNSITHILDGLKTAFLTSIVGMGTSIFLSIIQKLGKQIDDENREEFLLSQIVEKLDNVKSDDIEQFDFDKLLGEMERLRAVNNDSKDEIIQINNNILTLQNSEIEHHRDIIDSFSKLEDLGNKDIDISQNIANKLLETNQNIELLKNNNQENNQELIKILDSNFSKMNSSLEIAIDKLSKGATEEIINALKQVIENFNEELQTQFGENFIKLNESVINLLDWQENYKSYIEQIEKDLDISIKSIELSSVTLEKIANNNAQISEVYKELEEIIKTYKVQTEELSNYIENYAILNQNIKEFFPTLQETFNSINSNFVNLTGTIEKETKEQGEKIKEYAEQNIEEIKNVHTNSSELVKEKFEEINSNFTNLTENIGQESVKQQKEIKNFIRNSAEIIFMNIEENNKKVELITEYFKKLGEEIPTALKVSLENLNNGLATLTRKFKDDYEDVLNQYKKNIKR